MSGLAVAGYSPRSSAAPAAPSPSQSAAPPSKAASSASSTPRPSAPLATLPKDKAANLVVLGDSASNETSEWVNALGSTFGQMRSTSVRRINQADGASYNDPMQYGSEDPALQVWNASATPAVKLTEQSVTSIIADDPSLVLISQGRECEAEEIANELTSTLEAVRSAYPKAPVAVVLQPDLLDGSKQQSLTAVGRWAKQEGLPTIDVAKAFASADDPTTLQTEEGEVTEAGHEVWASTVHKAIAG